MSQRRVVVTGLGMITAVGLDTPATWQALLAGHNGVDKIQSFPVDEYRTTFAAEVKGFDAATVMGPKDARKADRFCQFAVCAAEEAMAMAQPGEIDPQRAGVIIGSGIGGMITFETQHARLLNGGPRRVSPLFIPMMIGDMAAGLVSIRYGYKGPNYATVSACASSGHAIAAAYDQIVKGNSDLIITGGTEATICPMALAGFGAMKALSTRNDDPAHASRPFDLERDGFVLGEGAGILILETAERAEARGADVIAEVVGYGMTGDAYHMTQPDNEGFGGREAMAGAIRTAGIQPQDVGYINAHGTSTYFNDKIETRAIKDLFGSHAADLVVGSTKSMTGHLLGAAGGVEGAITALALKHGHLPPTINLEQPDPECDLDYCANSSREHPVEFALSNSFGFGGHNISLCFKAV
ncbi:MAG: beta-ketoacyl-ACP synthase II [bacterium]